MRSLIKLFGCGNIYKRGNAFDFCVIKFGDITQNIIPFFKNPPPRIGRFQFFSHTSGVSKNNLKLNPWFVSGFSDREASFHVFITKNKKDKLGRQVRLFFKSDYIKRIKRL